MASDRVYYYPSYSSGAYDKHQRSLSPYAGAEMGRAPSNRGYSSSRWSTDAVSPSASSPDRYSPESPGGGITDSLSSFDFNSNSEQQQQQQQQPYNAHYAEPTTSTSYQLYHSIQSPSSSASASLYSTQATTGSQSQQQGDSWFQYYDFIAKVEQGQAPYWQLKPGYTPSKDCPAIMPVMPVVQEADSTPRSTEILHPCLAPGCDSKPFKRKADLERHYQQVHWDSATKTSYPCDYPRCPRATDYFYRRDHCRDHYREYHKEDLVRRSPGGPSSSLSSSSSSSSKKKETAEWWADRNTSKKWWRCSKCLRRVSIQLDGFECRDCKAVCETERRRFRGYA